MFQNKAWRFLSVSILIITASLMMVTLGGSTVAQEGGHIIAHPGSLEVPDIASLRPEASLLAVGVEQVVLYDQINNLGVRAIASQQYESVNAHYDSQTADDFIVPAADGIWAIARIEVLGAYAYGPGPMPLVNVYVYANQGGLPGVAVYRATGIVPTSDSSGDLTIDLPSPAVLLAGTYWLSVQADMDFNPNGAWFWRTRTVQTDNSSVWKQPGDAFGTGCTDWMPSSTCWPAQADERDTLFRLIGLPHLSPQPFADTPSFNMLYGFGDLESAMSVVVGDLNDDGALDLVMGSGGFVLGEQNKVFINDGTGTFSSGIPFGGSDKTESVALGDLDGDGDLDIVVGNTRYDPGCGCYVGDQNWIYLNDGTGTSYSGSPFGGSDFTSSVALGDLDGDGDLDIVAGNTQYDPDIQNYVGDQNLIYFNTGSGSFTSGVAFGPSQSATWSVKVGDLNGDGALDIVVGNYLQQNRVYLNNGTGAFPSGIPFGPADKTQSIAIGDLNGDQALDLVVGNGDFDADTQNFFYLNDGTGGFPTGISFGNPDKTQSVAVGDLNGDRALDILVGNWYQQNVVFLNDTTGAFASTIPFESADPTTDVTLGDLDGDGALDPIVGNWKRHSLIYLNKRTGPFHASTAFGDLDSVSRVALGDLDGDDDLDLVVGNTDVDFQSGAQNRVFFNNGLGNFASSTSFGPGTSQTHSVAVGDLNGDDALDLVVGNFEQQNLVYVNDGTGAFASGTPFGGTDRTQSVALGDLNGDGTLDLVVGNHDQQNLVYLNNGTGTFASATPFGSADATTVVTLGDVNRDGALDLVVGNSEYDTECGCFTGAQNLIYWNDGAGSFGTGAPFGGSDNTWSLALGDLDGDGALDLVVGNYFQQNLVYLNDGLGGVSSSNPFGGADPTESVALGDLNGDGTLDLVVGNRWYQRNLVYLNDGAGSFSTGIPFGDPDSTRSVALGDLDGDGALDLVVGNFIDRRNLVYLNGMRLASGLSNNMPFLSVERPVTTENANFYSTPAVLSDATIPIPYTLFDPEGDRVGRLAAYYSADGGENWHSAVAAGGTVTTNLVTGLPVHHASVITSPIEISAASSAISSTLFIPASQVISDLEVWLTITHDRDRDLDVYLESPSGTRVELFTDVGGVGTGFIDTILDDDASTSISVGAAPFTGRYQPEGSLSSLDSETTRGTWILWITDDTPATAHGALISWGINLETTTTPLSSYIYNWDTFASGFFGQSDNVVVRLTAFRQPASTGSANSYQYTHRTPGPYQWPYAAATTFPFRVRGTQVRVFSGTVAAGNEAVGAFVYRRSEGSASTLLTDASGEPFRTDHHGYLQGRGEILPGDQLLALLPISSTGSYTLYYTSGAPTPTGVDADTVSHAGVQTLTVSADHPLLLFDLDVSLEWDAHRDAAYLEQLSFNLQRASEYLYDFTNGQVALGQVDIFQNADNWAYSHILVHATNRLRPLAAQGGIVTAPTVDPQHEEILYDVGQVHMGATWNRYGNPGQSLGEDWPIILAHELGHYLLFHDDTYLGLNANGHLIAVDTCLGSAMGDLYYDPDATEFIANEAYWQANCSNTLAEQTLSRNEWETMSLWYPDLISPSSINSGPTLMPFDLTSIRVFDPYTPTATLEDPTFYLDYLQGGVSSSEARAFLLKEDRFVFDLGSPFGGQNRVLAHGAQPGDRLCVFDRPLSQYGCEVIHLGDDRLHMERDTSWNPVIQVSPVNSTTLDLQVASLATGLSLQARLYPEFGPGSDIIALSPAGDLYDGRFDLLHPAMSGHVQVWVNELATETNPRREAIVAFAIAGNPALLRGSGALLRGSGALLRGSGALLRGSGALLRGSGAPIVSPDGQMIFFTENPAIFGQDEFYTIQGMAGLPSLPPGRTVIGQGYRLVATPGTPLVTGSVSIQYLSNDVLVAGADEDWLTIYFHDGSNWSPLPTVRNAYFNLTTAPSQGRGLYALMASVQIPLRAPGWNLFAYPLPLPLPVSQALLSIHGYYTTVYGYLAEEADPWKLFQVDGPPYLNSLTHLEPGRGYWISATQAITVHMSNPIATSLTNGVWPASPPDTFYGPVRGGATFTPTPGMDLVAYVDDIPCGRSLLRDYLGDTVYVVHVDADDGTERRAGCGQREKPVTFYVDGLLLAPTAIWDNRQLDLLTLAPQTGLRLYLPLVFRKN